MSAAPALPPLLAANPRLDRWVGFDMPGKVTVSTGRVEIGQGVLTAMRQIAAGGTRRRARSDRAALRRHRSDPQ